MPFAFDLVEIGEAVKASTPSLLVSERDLPWKTLAAMRNQLGHRYFDTEHGIVTGTVTDDLEPLLTAVHRLQSRVPRETE